MSEVKVGRPPKKGRRSWKPASLNEFHNKEDGFRYRMMSKDTVNLAKKEAEGWEIVSGLQSADTEHVSSGRMNDGKSLSSVQQGHDWVLGKIPEELAVERDAYYNNETARRTAGLTAHIRKDLSKEGAKTHGNITISSNHGTQVIE